MPSPRKRDASAAEPSPRKRPRGVPSRLQIASSRSSAESGPTPRSGGPQGSPKAADGSKFGQRMRQRPLVVDKTLPIVTRPEDIPAGAMLDDGSAHPGGSPQADGEAAVAAAGGDVADPGLARSMSQPDRHLEIPIPS
jgi:hypothetical protein